MDALGKFTEDAWQIMRDGISKAFRAGRAHGINEAAEFLVTNIKQGDFHTLDIARKLLTLAKQVATDQEKKEKDDGKEG
jgi:hypothetical protein